MSTRLHRRTVLGTALGVGAVAGLAGPARSLDLAAPRPVPVAGRASTVALGDVRLTESRFLANMRRTTAYLRDVDLDRLLHMFRVTAGLPSSAQPLGGWEAPDVQLRGHTTGHLLSGLALASANLGDEGLADRGRRLVAALAACQERSPAMGHTPGYLSAFPEKAFVDLEAGKNVWAPYYTLHKVMAGLLDQHRLLGNDQALEVLLGMVGWVDTRTSALTREQMQKVLHTEFGGVNETLANLWFVTRDPHHLELAARFDHDEIFGPLAERRNTLAGRHANTDLAKVVGAAVQWEATGEERYRTIATYFWDQVVQHHTYVIGGNSNAEFFGPPGQIVSQLGENTCENCNSYNMLKLSRQLFLMQPDRADYMDYYEWTLLNQMLGEQDPDSAHGFVTYYTGLSPTASRKGKEGLVSDPGSYSSDYGNFSCDHGSALETQVKYADSVFFTRGDEVFVNLFVPSVLDWDGAGHAAADRHRLPVRRHGAGGRRARGCRRGAGPDPGLDRAPRHTPEAAGQRPRRRRPLRAGHLRIGPPYLARRRRARADPADGADLADRTGQPGRPRADARAAGAGRTVRRGAAGDAADRGPRQPAAGARDSRVHDRHHGRRGPAAAVPRRAPRALQRLLRGAAGQASAHPGGELRLRRGLRARWRTRPVAGAPPSSSAGRPARSPAAGERSPSTAPAATCCCPRACRPG